MATRRDQLQSYQFLTRRVISAFVMRETDPEQSPLRRGVGAVFGGVMITVIVAAVFGIYGVFTRVGGDGWQQDGAVVVERETGATFVYFEDRLHPTLNYASALLAAGRPHPEVFRQPRASLADVPRGAMIGIPEAPGSLPDADSHVGLPWSLCTSDGSVTLAVAETPDGGTPLDDGGMLVSDLSEETVDLVWHGHRYRLADPDTLVPALFGATVEPVPVGTSWRNALPVGTDIEPVTLDDRGEPSVAVADWDVGDLLVAETGSGPQHYLVLADGLAPITPLAHAVEVAYGAGAAAPVSISEANAAPRSDRLVPTGDAVPPPPAAPSLPSLPSLVAGDLACAVVEDAGSPPEIILGGSLVAADAATPTRSTSETGTSLADQVYVPAGHVAVVRAVAAPDDPAGSYSIVTDLGFRYSVPEAGTLQLLGYEPEHAVAVPVGLVTRIPEGPALDPVAAGQPVESVAG